MLFTVLVFTNWVYHIKLGRAGIKKLNGARSGG
jgi:hypothetical protein